MIEVRQMTREDVEGVVSLQRSCFPAPFSEDLLWQPEHIRRHLELFPAGQMVAINEDKVVGSCSNTIVDEATWCAHLSWEETVGGPMLEGFAPAGNTLYGLDVSVHPSWRGRGLLRAFYQQRFNLVRSLGLIRYGTAVRIPGFAAYLLQSPDSTPEDYVETVKLGLDTDRTLTPMLRVGLTVESVIRGYMEDPESGNAAAVLFWTP